VSRTFLKFFFVLIIGALGGMIFQAFILPYLATKPYFQRFQFIKILTEREVNVYPTETVVVQENVALQRTIEKVEKTVIGVQTRTKAGKILEGSGLILTSDGLVVTLADIVPYGSDFNFFWEKEQLLFQVLKRDLKNNLALIKIEKANFSTTGFADLEKTKLGQRVFLLGIIFEDRNFTKIVNTGVIKAFNKNAIRTNIFEKSILKGSPLFDIEGNVLGLNTIDFEGKVTAIPINKIQEFAGF